MVKVPDVISGGDSDGGGGGGSSASDRFEAIKDAMSSGSDDDDEPRVSDDVGDAIADSGATPTDGSGASETPREQEMAETGNSGGGGGGNGIRSPLSDIGDAIANTGATPTDDSNGSRSVESQDSGSGGSGGGNPISETGDAMAAAGATPTEDSAGSSTGGRQESGGSGSSGGGGAGSGSGSPLSGIGDAMADAGATPTDSQPEGGVSEERANAVRDAASTDVEQEAQAARAAEGQRQSGALSPKERLEAQILANAPADADVSPEDVDIERRQVSDRGREIAETTAEFVGIESNLPENTQLLEADLSDDARQSIVRQRVATEEGVPSERVRVQEIGEDGVRVQVEPEPLFGDQFDAVRPGGSDYTGGGATPGIGGPSPATLTGPNRGVIRPALQDATVAFESNISEPIRGGESTAERAGRGFAATSLEFVEPASSINFALGGTDASADILQEGTQNAAAGPTEYSTIAEPFVETERAQEIGGDATRGGQALGESFAEDPVVTSAEASGAALATLAPFAARSPRLSRARIRGRASAREFIADETATLGRGRTRGGDEAADAGDDVVRLTEDDLLGTRQTEPGRTPEQQATRQQARDEFERFNEGRDPVTPSRDTGPGGDFVAERVSGREVPDSGVDTARSGARNQDAANSARFSDVFDEADITPRERQLIAQGRDPADVLDDVPGTQTTATATAQSTAAVPDRVLSGLIAAQQPTVSAFDDADVLDRTQEVLDVGLSEDVGTGATATVEPDVETQTPGPTVQDPDTTADMDDAVVGDSSIDTTAPFEIVGGAGIAASDIDVGVDTEPRQETRTDTDTRQRERQRQRQRGREENRQRQRQRERQRNRGRQRRRVRGPPTNTPGTKQPRNPTDLPDTERDRDDDDERFLFGLDAAEERDIFELPDPMSDFLEDGL